MNEYLFYTTEGETFAPNEDVAVDNCQILGRIEAENAHQAKDKLLLENTWIEEAGFDASEIFVQQTITKAQKADIKNLLDYLWIDEEKHYEETTREEKSKHILNTLKRLKLGKFSIEVHDSEVVQA